MRVFDDTEGTMWKASVKDIEAEVLCVSQFTLMANTTKGNKPDFHNAMVRLNRLSNKVWLHACQIAGGRVIAGALFEVLGAAWTNVSEREDQR